MRSRTRPARIASMPSSSARRAVRTSTSADAASQHTACHDGGEEEVMSAIIPYASKLARF